MGTTHDYFGYYSHSYYLLPSQANGLVERFHRQLKGALRAQSGTHSWTESLPLVLLGIRTALKEDLHCTAAELVYGMSLRLPGEFFSSSSLPSIPDSDYVTRLKQYMGTLRATPARNPLSRNSFIDDSLSSTSHVFIRRDAVKKPLQQPYDGPFRVLSRTDKYFVVDINGKQDTVSIDRLKSAHIDHSNTTLPSTLSSNITPTITPPTTTLPTVTSSTPITRTRSGCQVRFPTHLNL